jgi:hypothetical protein
MALTADAKSGFNALKTHWVAALVLAAIVAGLVVMYDKDNPGKIRGWFAKLPIIGSKFA